MDKIAISEIFYSIQGEGKTMGSRSVFVRLGGCNLMCGGQGTQFDQDLHNGATWRCDTIEVWMKAQSVEIYQALNDEMIEHLKNGAHLIITGGEPLMQQKAIHELIRLARFKAGRKIFVEIETNGTIMPSEFLISLVDQWNVSPKLANSGNERAIRINEKALNFFNANDQAFFKFVVSGSGSEIPEIQDLGLKSDKIWLMPQGESRSAIDQIGFQVAELCKNNGYNYSHRLHLSLWDQKTGV